MIQKSKQLPSIGLIGGGQLGRMFLQNSSRYGNKVVILENDPQSPAGVLTNHFIEGNIKDAQAIKTLAEECDVISYEIEHINVDALFELEAQGKKVIPSANILKTIQDKGLQKQFYHSNDIPTAPFRLVNQPNEWVAAMEELGGTHFAAKSRTGGYDGKGVLLTDIETVKNDPSIIPFEDGVMIEKFIPCQKELAVLVAIGQDGSHAVYPSVDMAFHPISNLVTYLFTPADINVDLEKRVQELALKTVQAFGGAGLFAVEFFLDNEQKLWVNEIAPRPHNSAHHTIEGSYTSQFDQMFRILAGLPLGSTTFRQAAVMVNLVGPEDGEGDYYLDKIEEVLEIEGVYIHMYGKITSKPHRKLGHVTIINDSIEKAREIADFVESTLKVKIIC
ncbi:MAG TPA: 5-(carboxyamino)imidazole ribonucleotide synthase [Chitinophagales bacterium]|nr:5-(carboxyamino)imidazole ribonucleotide synthase [Chitinophagales bacterium]